ncbi:PDZ domain (Also known as DHR or GLGF) [Enhygromyxa salina]|uniref:PDZ domain (Also known as DHR or GLGF) n=2 Tax=Enhygromyxa salina TaxID=215803 RepID=A0A2S9XB36_9BACT|nr:PDZ domain (Also known as DHR or GLGF) [Enhygromyxa salina]
MGVAALGLILVVATLLWFAGEGSDAADRSGDHGDSSGELDRAARSTAPTGRHVDAANSIRSSGANTAHEAQPAQLSADSSVHGALEGRVVDWGTRVGVAGAELSFVQGGVTHETVTGSDGRYRFDAPAAGAWSLAMVTAEGYLPYAPELGRGSVVWVPSPGHKLERADLFLFPSVDYVGTVVDAQGHAVADAEVELFGADSGERALVGIESSFRTDSDGRFEFHAPDFALLEARHPDHPPGRARVDGPAQISRTLTITMGGAPAGSAEVIRGRVVDGSGKPLAGVEVVGLVAMRGEGASVGRSPATVSESDGSFVLAPLDELPYVVRAKFNARPSVQRGPVKPGAEVELRVEDGLELRGRLVDEHGDAIVAGTVALMRVAGPLRRGRIAGLSVFDPGGAFSFGGLRPGKYELEAIAQGRARSEPVAVTLPHTGKPVAVVLGSGASVFGRVVDARSGDPLARAQVSVRGLSRDDSVLPSLSSTVTDDEGEFELGGIEPGRVSIDVKAFEHDGRIVSGVELAAGDRQGPIEVSLKPVAEGERPRTELAGIGVAIAPSSDAVYIRQVIEGGGAEAAGIVVGDSILAVDGEEVVKLGFEDAMQRVRGEVGTTVRLELRRKEGEVESLTVERRLISEAF